MRADKELPALLEGNGWMKLAGDTYFRWMAGSQQRVREELHIVFNKSGNVFAWSVWHNKQVTAPDQEPGTRNRLEKFIDDTSLVKVKAG